MVSHAGPNLCQKNATNPTTKPKMSKGCTNGDVLCYLVMWCRKTTRDELSTPHLFRCIISRYES